MTSNYIKKIVQKNRTKKSYKKSYKKIVQKTIVKNNRKKQSYKKIVQKNRTIRKKNKLIGGGYFPYIFSKGIKKEKKIIIVNIGEEYDPTKDAEQLYMIAEGGYKEKKPIIFNDGNYFGEGDDDDEKRSGKGVMEYDNEDVYIGYWKDDMRSGMGILEYKVPEVNETSNQITKRDKLGLHKIQPSPIIYIGEFKDDMMNGFGKLKYNNEFTYVGYWKDGKRHGTGLYYNKMIHFIGDWKDDVFVEGEKIIFGTKTHYQDDSSYTDYYIEKIWGKFNGKTDWSELSFNRLDARITKKERTYKLKKELKKELL